MPRAPTTWPVALTERRRHAGGVLDLTLAGPPERLEAERWAALLEPLVSAGLERRGQRDGGGRVTWTSAAGADVEAWVKGGRLTAGSARRHQLGRLRGRLHPRASEFRNLAWLGAQGLPAVRPLVAGLWYPLALGPPLATCRLQFLATEWIPGARSLEDALPVADAPERRELSAALGTLLARLHLARFEHRDCFLRNFVIDAAGQLSVLDAWRGGPRREQPGPRDLADLIAEADELFGGSELRALVEAYTDALESAGAPGPGLNQLARAVRQARSRLGARARSMP